MVWHTGGLRVVELGRDISAAYGARLLADFGADVIKVEHPEGGDPARAAGPFRGDEPDPEQSGRFLLLNYGKRSVTLDVTTAVGATQLARLLANADVLIENLGAGALDALPLPADALSDRLVVCSISPYGQDGPKAGYLGTELTAYAAGGMMYITGTGDREPLKHGLDQAAHLAGVNAASAVLAAAMLAKRTGRGQRIDISEQETVAQTIFPALNLYSHTGAVMKRTPAGLTNLINSAPMRAKDGWVMPSYAGLGQWWESFAGFIECPELLEERFSTPDGRRAHGAEIDDLVGPRFAAREKADLFHEGQDWGLTMTAVQTAGDIAECPHLRERGFFIEQVHPAAGTVRMPGPVPIAEGVTRDGARRAPLLGEHTDEVLAALESVGPAPTQPAVERRSDTAERAASGLINGRPRTGRGVGLPLEGVRILELGMVFVLPYAITPLAALGADVVKIEAESRPDQVRWGPPPDNEPRPDGYNHGGHFQSLNRDKRGITIDLSKPEGRDLFLQLVAVSDVVAENFTPRVLRNLNITYEQLREANPKIILLSSSGYGHSGPWQQYRAYGPNSESVDGLMHLTGYPGGPPVRAGAGGLGVAFTDAAGAFYGSYSILAALEYRERTGLGQRLDLSHYEAGVSCVAEAVVDYEMNGRDQSRVANRHRDLVQGVYQCTGDDRWIAISVASDDQFAALVEVLERPALLGDERFQTQQGRLLEHDAFDEAVGAATRGLEAVALAAALQTAGIAAAAASTPRDVWLDGQLRHRGFFEMLPAGDSAPEIGPRPHLRPAWKMSGTPAETRMRAPEFGEHTAEVLSEFLGFGEEELAELTAAGVTATAPRAGLIARARMDLPTMVSEGRLREADPDFRERLEAQFAAGSPADDTRNDA